MNTAGTPYYRLQTAMRMDGGHVSPAEGSAFVAYELLGGVPLPQPWLDTTHGFVLAYNGRRPLRPGHYYPECHLMSRQLIEVLLAAGASNLQLLKAEVTVAATGERLNDYAVVNIVGLVSCADDAASDSTPLAEGRFYFDLQIDGARTGGARMFRLAESLIDVIVDSRLAEAIRAADLFDLVLDPVS